MNSIKRLQLEAILGTKALLDPGKPPTKKAANRAQWEKDKRRKKAAKKAKRKNRK